MNFWLWILKNWIPITGTSLLTLGLCFTLHTVDKNMTAAKHKTELTNLETALKARCEADKAITSEVSNEYQTQISNLNVKLRNARRLLKQSCVTVVADTASPDNANTTERKPTGSNVILNRVGANDLIDIAAEGEEYRLQLIGCQSFIRKTWEKNLND